MFASAEVLKEKSQQNKPENLIQVRRDGLKRLMSSAVSIGETIVKYPLKEEDLSSDWLEVISRELERAGYSVEVVNEEKPVLSDVFVAHLVIDWE